jgi:diadenylate cyclase
VLPLSDQQGIRASFGTRHRAALGVVEETDALALVVSEETGAISIAHDSMLFYNLERVELEQKLKNLLNLESSLVPRVPSAGDNYDQG